MWHQFWPLGALPTNHTWIFWVSALEFQSVWVNIFGSSTFRTEVGHTPSWTILHVTETPALTTQPSVTSPGWWYPWLEWQIGNHCGVLHKSRVYRPLLRYQKTQTDTQTHCMTLHATDESCGLHQPISDGTRFKLMTSGWRGKHIMVLRIEDGSTEWKWCLCLPQYKPFFSWRLISSGPPFRHDPNCRTPFQYLNLYQSGQYIRYGKQNKYQYLTLFW